MFRIMNGMELTGTTSSFLSLWLWKRVPVHRLVLVLAFCILFYMRSIHPYSTPVMLQVHAPLSSTNRVLETNLFKVRVSEPNFTMSSHYFRLSREAHTNGPHATLVFPC